MRKASSSLRRRQTMSGRTMGHTHTCDVVSCIRGSQYEEEEKNNREEDDEKNVNVK
eukprot:m.54215 g.54215  ORF g.54215 m.54215 type:complete len:56 (-) comp18488_c0_seq1:58-225(-)